MSGRSKRLRREVQMQNEDYMNTMAQVGPNCDVFSIYMPEEPEMAPDPDPLTTTCTCEKFDQKLTDMEGRIQSQLNVLQEQLKMTIELLAEQSVLLRDIRRAPLPKQPLQMEFPISCEEELMELNNNITQDNKATYVKTIKALIQSGGISKSLKNVITSDITQAYNLEGTHGKKGLKKEFKNFYNILTEAIAMTKEGQANSAEGLLRRAIQLQKKRLFKQISNIKLGR